MGLNCAETIFIAESLMFRIIIGASLPPKIHPKSSPIGMPKRERVYACRRIMDLICFPVVPMVFSRP